MRTAQATRQNLGAEVQAAAVVDAARGGWQHRGCLSECIMNSRYWRLAKRPPPPWPDDATFALREAPVPAPGPGQALTRTIYVSLDPYQWGRARRGGEPEGRPSSGPATWSPAGSTRPAARSATPWAFSACLA